MKSVTFANFCAWTEIDFVVAGSNLTTGRPGYFSRLHTPNFPVIGAVRLSMSIPFMFKPVYIETTDPQRQAYAGYWADGGILNNLPMHAFNGKDGKRYEPWELVLTDFNSATLGFVLQSPPGSQNVNDLSILTQVGRLMDTFLYPGGAGQLVDKSASANAIRIGTGRLSTYELGPPMVQVCETLDCAWCDTVRWFVTARPGSKFSGIVRRRFRKSATTCERIPKSAIGRP